MPGRVISLAYLLAAGCACALSPYTLPGDSAGASSETTGGSATATTDPPDGTAAPGQKGLGENCPLWPPVPCTYSGECPVGDCIDPQEDYDQEYSSQRYCLCPLESVQQCSAWSPTPGCPAGTKCVHSTWDGGPSGCLPVLPDPLATGAACEKIGPYADGLWVDNCGPDAGCYFGECRQLCTFDEDSYPHCPPGQFCNAARISLWCVPYCDPLLQDCGPGFVCIDPGDGWYFECIPDGSGDGGQVFDPCEAANGCDPGLLCASTAGAVECAQNAAGCCLPLCDTLVPNCPGAGQQCVPWYPEGESPPGFENLGLCSLPV